MLAERFRAGARLVTLVGPAGVGKTRLARELARLRSDPPSVVCELGMASRVDELAHRVAAVLNVPLGSVDASEDAIATVGRALSARGPLLVILDGFDELVDVASGALARWLEAAPRASLLVTSRRRLPLPGAPTIEVRPLALPERSRDAIATYRESPAIALLLDRARCVRHDFAVAPGDAPVLCELVHRLDGLPLAIELIAARLSTYSPRQLLERLHRRFELLASPRSDDPAARTLRGALDSSWELLGETERSVLAQLSVFRGSFDLESVELVVQIPETDGARSVFDVLFTLVEHSLVTSRDEPRLAGERRQTLLESVRDYAGEQLERSGDPAAAEDRHRRHFAARARTYKEEVHGHDGLAIREKIAIDTADLLAAHDRAMRSDRPDAIADAIELLLGIERSAIERGPIRPYLDRLDRTLAAVAQKDVPAPLLAHALAARANAELYSGGLVGATRSLERALASAIEAGEAALAARMASRLSVALAIQGRRADAEARRDEAAHALTHIDDTRCHAEIHRDRATLLTRWGVPVEARAEAERALALFRKIGDRREEAFVQLQLGLRAYDDADLEQASGRLAAVAAIVAELGDLKLEGVALNNLAWIAQEHGNFDEARALRARALSLQERIGVAREIALVRLSEGLLDLEDEQPLRAEESLGAAVEALSAIGDMRFAPLALSGLGVAAAMRDRVDEARRRFTAADDAYARAAAPHDRVTHALLRAHLVLAEARAAERDDGPAEVAALLARDDAASGGGAEQRYARRLLEKALSHRAVLQLGPEGRWFALGAERVDLSRRRALRLVLLALVDQRQSAPGVGIDGHRLFEAGWPGDRANVEAALNRVKTAVHQLRTLGLRKVLQTRDDGYVLDSDLAIVRTQ